MGTKDNFLVEMGKRLLYQRQKIGLTQEKLAELSGLSVKTIISAEKGQKALRPENIVRICQTLSMDISYFMAGEISNLNMLSSLNHRERVALNQIAEAFLSVCENKEES